MLTSIQMYWVLLVYSVFMMGVVSGTYERKPIENVNQQDIIDRVNYAIYLLDTLKTHETNIISQSMVDVGSPFQGVLISYRPDTESLVNGRAGILGTRATQMMIALHCSGLFEEKRQECTRKASLFTMMNTKMHDICTSLSRTCTKEEYNSPYRRVTGVCNDMKSHVGASFTAYGRILEAAYLDGIETPRRAVNKEPLPNARAVSHAFTKFNEVLHEKLTMAALQWGQFLEQDLSRPALSPMFHYETSFKCCRSDGSNLAPRYFHKFCAPISLSSDDYYSKKYKYCMSYARSFPALRPDCSFGPQEQMNQATHYLDGSQIYGSSYINNLFLRGTNGRYNTSKINNHEFLPLSQDPKQDCLVADNDSLCFVSGDPRVNFEPQMVAMHTLWAREHNRLVDGLTNLNNTQWTDDDIYEEARRIIVAMMQHITYNEWISNVLANKYLVEINKFTAYRENIDPFVLNTVGVAALRSLKSMYPGKISLYSEDREEHNDLNLRSLFYKPEILTKLGTFDSVVRGIATQPTGKVDMHYDEDLINKLYVADDFGYDILTLDIQRSRDHGLPSYNSYREYLGFKYAESFGDLADLMSSEDYNHLSDVYKNPSDIDLIVGGILERPVSNSLFGPTISWLLSNQLIRTRQADRYFYTNPKQPKPFTKSQLGQIKKITLARIMCDNSNIQKIQPNVFQTISESNNLVSCDSKYIPRLDLRPWIIEDNAYTID